jgi:hypothetical protein
MAASKKKAQAALLFTVFSTRYLTSKSKKRDGTINSLEIKRERA